MVQRIPNYSSVTVNGTMTIGAFSTSTGKGGVLFFRSTGVVNVNSGGSITATGKGYTGATVNSGTSWGGEGGITYNGTAGRGTKYSNNSATSGQGGGGGTYSKLSADRGNPGAGTIGGAGGGGNFDSNYGAGGGAGYGGVGSGGATDGANGSNTIGGNGGGLTVTGYWWRWRWNIRNYQSFTSAFGKRGWCWC
ncbi:hypothetical protein HYW43_03690 [Candidatus Daviesbacteria bacterium]|nr:hypothetical protein [Candidatus Daviesbacteria bacterium]